MSQRTVSLLLRFAVPVERLWEAVVDHDGMGRWLGVPVRVIAGPGDGGVGTVRRLGRGPLSVDEEIVGVAPGRELVYRVVRGPRLLRYHLGEIRTRPAEGGSELWWEITIATPIAALTDAVAATLSERIGQGLDRLRARLEA